MRTLFIVVIFASIMVVFFFFRQPTTIKPKLEQTRAPIVSFTPSPLKDSLEIDNNGRIYRVAWLEVNNPSTVSLIPNFTEKRTARSLIESKECTEVVNGGFYTKENQPTGLFTSEGKTLRNAIPNSLLNGVFSIDKDNRPIIDATAPNEPVRIGLQTGPILIRNGKSVNLTIHEDEFARRIIAAVTQEGTIIFLAVYDPENPWSGPRLADTPDILSKIAARLQLRDVINLDGGSASVFIRRDITLEELTPVGSFFCIQYGKKTDRGREAW